MEGKAHRRRDYSPAGRISRIERDLSSCSLGSESSFESDTSTMLGRVTLRSRAGSAAKTPHVCVVGAGFSGLRCAEVLSEKGIKVTILEGRDRIGGRVYQDNHLGHLVDMGANWIHGTDRNPILDLAKETNTVASSIGESSGTFDELGEYMDEKKAERLSELVWGIIADAFKYSNDASSIPPDRSLEDFFVEKLEEKDLSQEDTKIVLQIARMWGAFIGDPIERQSLKYFWLEECIDGENLFVASTYKAILDRVGKRALASATVHLSTYVNRVHTRDSMLTGAPGRVKVVTNDDTLEFDEVVITASLGSLKRNEPAFYPQLPARLSRAIKNISYGRLEKVYIRFPTAFWDPPHGHDSGSAPDGEPSAFPFFSHFLHPLYHPGNPHSWNVELVSLTSVLPRETRHPTLLFYIHGPCAAYITNLIHSMKPTSPEYYSRLNEFFKPYYSRLPNFNAESETCRPSGILATDWSHDRLAGYGSYTNFQISHPTKEGEQEVELDKDIEALREGLPERAIWLAGEHTAPFVALGTVTGAYWSGEAVARRIAEAYGMGGGDEKVWKEDDNRATVKIGKDGETLNSVDVD
ncbi:hypothetical protein MMC17_009326 [Xylographa soralifera]|nr:hypothetical protein [Xylographa soralifera]